MRVRSSSEHVGYNNNKRLNVGVSSYICLFLVLSSLVVAPSPCHGAISPRIQLLREETHIAAAATTTTPANGEANNQMQPLDVTSSSTGSTNGTQEEGYWFQDRWTHTPLGWRPAQRVWIPVNALVLAALRLRAVSHPSLVGRFTWAEYSLMFKYGIKPRDIGLNVNYDPWLGQPEPTPFGQQRMGSSSDNSTPNATDGVKKMEAQSMAGNSGVNNGGGSQNSTFRTHFGIPIVDSFSRTTVSIAGGTLLTVYGTDFHGLTNLQIGIDPDWLNTPEAIASDGSWVTVRFAAYQTGRVTSGRVYACAEEFSPCSSSSWTKTLAYAAPTLSDVLPLNWCYTGTTRVTLYGDNFGYNAGSFYTYIHLYNTQYNKFVDLNPYIQYNSASTPQYSITNDEIVTGVIPGIPMGDVTFEGLNLVLGWAGSSVEFVNAGTWTDGC